ncbi:chemotaxis protein CheB [Rhodobacteraceae bacterium WD3A24]|nr:chemotaxis protein CheB [Rhodobacteraceae bacterium WD3A24]
MLLADGRPIRRARLAEQLAADGEIDLVAVSGSLTEAYNSTEAETPDAVAICGEMVERPEFGMFGALLKALGPHCVIYGAQRPARMRDRPAGKGPEFLPLDPTGSAAALAEALRRAPPRPAPAPTPPEIPEIAAQTLPVVAIGASTGGVEALQTVLAAFPENCPPTVIVQHIRGDFTGNVAARLDSSCAAHVSEATHGAPLQPGRIYLAPGNEAHLTIGAGPAPACRLDRTAPVSGHRPSVDALMRSAAAHAPEVVGALLTGMGRDGADGMAAIHRGGGVTIAQDAATSTVYGMPRVAVEMGVAEMVLPLPRIGAAIIESCRRQSSPDRKREMS